MRQRFQSDLGLVEMDGGVISDILVDALPRLSRLGAVVGFDLGKAGTYVVDARNGRAVIGQSDSPDCTIKISEENLAKLIRGDMDPIFAYAVGRIKVSGSMDVAMKLVRAIS